MSKWQVPRSIESLAGASGMPLQANPLTADFCLASRHYHSTIRLTFSDVHHLSAGAIPVQKTSEMLRTRRAITPLSDITANINHVSQLWATPTTSKRKNNDVFSSVGRITINQGSDVRTQGFRKPRRESRRCDRVSDFGDRVAWSLCCPGARFLSMNSLDDGNLCRHRCESQLALHIRVYNPLPSTRIVCVEFPL